MKTQGMNDFVAILVQDFAQKRIRKENYSLRAYARHLGVSHSTLHALMTDGSGGSSKLIEKIGEKIGLSKSEKEYFAHLASLNVIKDSKKRAEILQKIALLDTRYNILGHEEQTQVFCKWYGFAVMELIKTKDASLDPAWIAKKLRITRSEVEKTLDALQKLEIIEIQENGQLLVKKDYVELSPTTVLPTRELHQVMIGKAGEAAMAQPKETRSFSETVLRFRKSDMEEVHQFISKFRREFALKFESGTGHDSVYSLNVNFFRLDSEEK